MLALRTARNEIVGGLGRTRRSVERPQKAAGSYPQHKRCGRDGKRPTVGHFLLPASEHDRPSWRLGGPTFSALYVIYIVVRNRPDLYGKVQPIDIGLTEY
jgi:hypothetical protein